MQLWRPKFKLDGINSGSWYHCLPIRIYHWLGEGGCMAAVCEVVCYMEVRPGLSGLKMRWHFSEQRWEVKGVKTKTRNRWYNTDTRAKQAAMVWACVVKRRHWLGEEIIEYEVEGSRPRGRPKRTWKEVVQGDCQARNLNKEDAVDSGRWKKLIKIAWWSAWWVGGCFFWYRLTRVVPDKGP